MTFTERCVSQIINDGQEWLELLIFSFDLLNSDFEVSNILENTFLKLIKFIPTIKDVIRDFVFVDLINWNYFYIIHIPLD